MEFLVKIQPANSARMSVPQKDTLKDTLKSVADELIDFEAQYEELLEYKNELNAVEKGENAWW